MRTFISKQTILNQIKTLEDSTLAQRLTEIANEGGTHTIEIEISSWAHGDLNVNIRNDCCNCCSIPLADAPIFFGVIKYDSKTIDTIHVFVRKKLQQAYRVMSLLPG